MIATNAAALTVAERHGLAAPRLIAHDPTGNSAGLPASLETVLPGECGWPGWPQEPSEARLREAGAAIARTHKIRLKPWDTLAPRVRPIEYDDFARERRWATFYQGSKESDRRDVVAALRQFTGSSVPARAAAQILANVRSTPLLLHADEIVRRHGQPRGEQVFVHGDVWPGNTMWTGDTCAGLIDWKTAGVGHPGIDLGGLRFQLARLRGPDAADHALRGWEEEIGRKATDVAYWDAVAALNTRTDLDAVDGAGAQNSRDEFLRTAIANLGG
jgi:aminoglycoside phosphotransferase (APT) family kinase protein